MPKYTKTYTITLLPHEYKKLDRPLYVIGQYTALLNFLRHNKDIFDIDSKYDEWVSMLQADLYQANASLEVAKYYVSRTVLSFMPKHSAYDWRYDKLYHRIIIETNNDIEIPWTYQTRRPIVTIEDYINSTLALFDDEMPPAYSENTFNSRTITFQVTDACNLRCSYCYQICKSTHMMNKETADKMIEILLCSEENNVYSNIKELGLIVIDFIGGEPFLAVDLIDYICTRFIKRAFETENYRILKFFRFSICSNGVLYRDEKVQRFLEKWKDLLSFSVTLDGNEELHDACRVFPDGSGSYKYAVDAVTDCLNRGYIMGSKVTVAPGNVEYVYDAIKHMIDMGYYDIHANCVYEEGWTYDHAKIYYAQLKKVADLLINNRCYDDIIFSIFNTTWYVPLADGFNNNWCGGTGSMLAVNHTGNIYPCLRYMESSIGDDKELVLIGHVDTGLAKTEKELKTVDELRSVTRKSQSTEECWSCPIASGCGWCSAYNYQYTGSVNKRVTFICPMHKAEALVNNYYWNKMCKLLPINHEPFKICIPEEWALQIIDKDEWLMINQLYQEAKNAKLSIEDRK